MKVKFEQDTSLQDVEVLVRFAEQNKEVHRLEVLLRSADRSVKCRQEKEEKWVNVSDIFYAESIDKRTFVYGENEVFECELRLYQLLEQLKPAGFVQVSKSCIVNISKLIGLRSLKNSKMEASLTNGEKISVTRKFIACIRTALEEGRS